MFNPWGPAGVHPLPSPGPRSGRSEVLEGKGHLVRVRVGRGRGWRPRGGGRTRWGSGGSPSPALAPQPPAHPTCPHPWAVWLSAPAHPGPSRGAGPAALTLTPSLGASPCPSPALGAPPRQAAATLWLPAARWPLLTFLPACPALFCLQDGPGILSSSSGKPSRTVLGGVGGSSRRPHFWQDGCSRGPCWACRPSSALVSQCGSAGGVVSAARPSPGLPCVSWAPRAS